MQHLGEIDTLQRLLLDSTKIGNEGLNSLRKLPKLLGLQIHGTLVTDEGLEHLIGLKLDSLDLRQTKVTAAGVAALQKALPNCKIEWDGSSDRKAKWVPSTKQQAFFDEVAALAPEKQVESVRKKLQEVNPGFDGKVGHEAEKGRVVAFWLDTDHITEIWPVRAFVYLQSLTASGTSGPTGTERNGKLSDLSPLAGMPLTKLACHHTPVLSNLSPLSGMPLTSLDCSYTSASDFGPLKGMPLKSLQCRVTRASNLVPLEGMNLAFLDVYGTQITDADLKHLKGMANLTTLHLGATRVTDAGLAHVKELTSLTGLRVYPESSS